MFFSALSGLWFGLALPTILIMYLFKRKYIDTDISSHLLWHRALRHIEANRPWQKLQHQLLLYLQLLAAALLVLALMQPQLWVDRPSEAHVIAVLDRSASMQATLTDSEGHRTTRLDQAKQSLMTYLDEHDTQSLTLLTNGAAPEVVLAHSEMNEQWGPVIEGIHAYDGKASYKETMSLASALAREDDQSQVVLFTDGQWVDADTTLYVDRPIEIQRIQDDSITNISVLQFGVKRDISTAEELADAVSAAVTLKHWGDKDLDLTASLYAEETLVKVIPLKLSAGEQRSLYLDQAPVADYYRFQFEAEGDVLLQDNTAYAFLNDDQGTTALLLTEGNLFLEKALQLSDVTVIKAQQGAEGQWIIPDAEIDFVIFDRIPESGYSTEAWSNWLQDLPVWYIATGFGEQADLVVPKQQFEILQHEVTQYLQFSEVYIAEAMQVHGVSWGGKPIVLSDGLPLVFAGTDGGKPRLAFTFSFDQTDLPLRSEFPILVQNAVEWLSSQKGGSLGQFVAGETKEMPLSAKASHAEWTKLDTFSASIDALTTDGILTTQQIVPEVHGLYQFVTKNPDGDIVASYYLEAMMDPRESNLSYQPELKFVNADLADSSDENASEVNDKHETQLPYPMTAWIVLAALIVIFAEWEVYQRGSAI